MISRRIPVWSGLIEKRQMSDLSNDEEIEAGFPVADTNLKDEQAWLKKMDEKHETRINALRRACSDHYNMSLESVTSLATQPGRLRPLIVNDEHQFIYSIVYKVGSTNWERLLVEDLGGYKNVPNQKLYSHKAIHWMPRFNSTDIQQRLSKYTIFMFVRNPLARILSAYRDKFVNHHNSVFSKMGRSIVENYREKSDGSPATGNVTLTEFVRYLVDSPAHRANPHWKPIFGQNLPCQIRYDIVGKLEEAADDIPYVLRRLRIDQLVSYAQGQKKSTSEKDLLRKHFSQVPNDLLQKLCLIYRADFILFGYDIPERNTEV
ncbi:carbohydrate sulfotransferase 14-like isoform X2 [Acanthaster planci]|uniref:Carbohydrate sulfotransferase n=1 Tax=Acanthaster planci TaxID=133434 RepID=A0A8B7XWX5_ACAPL|nr:carbohydrate sulfotransferase 14-like isoform X2 [Acanthaster planci]